MRTIKFRVKNEAGDWKFLNLKTQFPNTLGQFTDFFDCNDNPIFEGDIVELLNSPASPKHHGVISFFNGKWIIDFQPAGFIDLFWHIQHYKIKVIGNIHENTEFL